MFDKPEACRGFRLWATQETFDKLPACRTFSAGGNVMKVGYLSLALVVVAFAGAPGNLASPTRIAFAQSQQPRNQTQPQEGLPPEKKTALSRMGPEEIFGVSGEDSRSRAPGKQQRKQQTTPPLSSPPPQRQPATSAGAPSAQPTATPAQSSTPAPSPTAVAGALENGLQSPTLGQVGSSDKILPNWATPSILIALALIFLAALTFTLIKLFEKIREGSSG
jgi:hypothetical protein